MGRQHSRRHRGCSELETATLCGILQLAVGVCDARSHRAESTWRREEEVDDDGDDTTHDEVGRVERCNVDDDGGPGVEGEEHQREHADETTAGSECACVAARSRDDKCDCHVGHTVLADQSAEEDSDGDPQRGPQHGPQTHPAGVGTIGDRDEE